jgi:hypothetical protein
MKTKPFKICILNWGEDNECMDQDIPVISVSGIKVKYYFILQNAMIPPKDDKQ